MKIKNIFAFTLILTLWFTSCNNDDVDDNLTIKKEASASLKFVNNWDGTPVISSDFENTEYTNANGEVIIINRLRYVISNLTFTKENGNDIVIEGHKLIDVTNNDLEYNPETKIPIATYTNLAFTYGLKHEDNITDDFADLNSANFNVPLAALGSAYHYMQFDGKYSNATTTNAPFNYHNIRAVVPGTNPTFPDQDTFITVNLGAITITNDVTIEIKSNIAEWFKNPILWDLNEDNQVLMPKPEVQLKMNQNGQNVFSLGAVIQ